ncbi:MAG TPA: PQQ-dependent sugar dehydrogenase [Methanothrix sp.]|nr:PQQ-dependent sugar dehydrogenase [Methanothrix sp.]
MKKDYRQIIASIFFLILATATTGCAEYLQTTVDIESYSFQPASINVTVGTTVTWINHDPTTHTVTADDGSFDSGGMANDGVFEHTFSMPGTYSYHCKPHPFMKGEVVVTAADGSNGPDPAKTMIGLEPVAAGFTAPIAFISAEDGTGRMFLVEQTGLVKIVEADGTVLEEPFLDLRDRMISLRSGFDERGLLGLAFHPDYPENGRLFVFYSAPLGEGAPEGWNCISHISEFSVSQSDPERVNATSEKIILQVDKPQLNHNGGTIAFGPDGYLYVPLGDGGGADDEGLGHAPDGNGQNTSSLLGKILRIDVDGAEEGRSYAIPADNPFVDREGILPEIYALGLRNPWRISFDEDLLYVSDAGQNLWEEVDLVTSGGNYGWNIREGTHCFGSDDCPDEDARGETLIDPIIEYGHDLGMAVVGGYVYRGQDLPELRGKYIFADWSKSFGRGDGTLLLAAPSADGLWDWEEIEVADSPSGRADRFVRSFGVDDSGEIYVLVSDEPGPVGNTGEILKIRPA